MHTSWRILCWAAASPLVPFSHSFASLAVRLDERPDRSEGLRCVQAVTICCWPAGFATGVVCKLAVEVVGVVACAVGVVVILLGTVSAGFGAVVVAVGVGAAAVVVVVKVLLLPQPVTST